jgi:hypothetical protein
LHFTRRYRNLLGEYPAGWTADGRLKKRLPAKSQLAGLNRRQKAVADLLAAAMRREMVQLGGLEPPTSGSTDQRSNHLSYSCTGCAAIGRAGGP